MVRNTCFARLRALSKLSRISGNNPRRTLDVTKQLPVGVVMYSSSDRLENEEMNRYINILIERELFVTVSVRVRRFQDLWTRTRIFGYTINISKNFF